MYPTARPWTVLRHSTVIALADFRATYTVYSWTFGWLVRMLAQALFFTLAASAFGAPGQSKFLVVGNSVMACAIESMMVVASSTWERRAGTLPLLMGAPVNLAYVFAGRSLQWPISGSLTSLVSLLLLAPWFGVRWTLAGGLTLLPLVLVTALGTYAFGLLLSALVLNFSGVRNIVSNAAYLIMMAICGVQVPTGFWPAWVQDIAWCFPLTHGLAAVRADVERQPLSSILGNGLIALLLGLLWAALAIATFSLAASVARRTASPAYS